MKTRLVVLALVVMALFIGCAMAAITPNATFETQGVKTTGSISVLKGSIATSQTMTMTVANNNDGVNAPPLEPSDDGPGERQATNVYTEMTDAKNGQNMEYSQTFNADTGNKVLGTNNVQAHRNIQYESDMTKDGRMSAITVARFELPGWIVWRPPASG